MGLKRTPLFEAHKRLGARLVDFGGWEMPVQYTSILAEHTATRERAGLFDVSHMGELTVRGAGAMRALGRLLSNDISSMTPGKIVYSPLMNQRGGVVDDLLVYMMGEEDYLLVVNACNTAKDFEWIKSRIEADGPARVEDASARYGQIAIQGPLAQAILQKLTEHDLGAIGFFRFADIEAGACRVIASRTGYTGEDGFELYCDAEETEKLWEALLEAGKGDIAPVGLGARDTLRFEAGLPLYGHELSEEISPIEAGLKAFVKLDKGKFLGREVLERHALETEKKLVGIELADKGIPREGFRIEKDGADIGWVASGTHSPTFAKGLATGFVRSEFAAAGTEIDVVIRDKRARARIVKLPFYKKKTRTKISGG